MLGVKVKLSARSIPPVRPLTIVPRTGLLKLDWSTTKHQIASKSVFGCHVAATSSRSKIYKSFSFDLLNLSRHTYALCSVFDNISRPSGIPSKHFAYFKQSYKKNVHKVTTRPESYNGYDNALERMYGYDRPLSLP